MSAQATTGKLNLLNVSQITKISPATIEHIVSLYKPLLGISEGEQTGVFTSESVKKILMIQSLSKDGLNPVQIRKILAQKEEKPKVLQNHTGLLPLFQQQARTNKKIEEGYKTIQAMEKRFYELKNQYEARITHLCFTVESLQSLVKKQESELLIVQTKVKKLEKNSGFRGILLQIREFFL